MMNLNPIKNHSSFAATCIRDMCRRGKRLTLTFSLIFTLFTFSGFAQLIDSYGDEFWIAFPANYEVSESNTSLQLFIAAKQLTTVQIDIEAISFSLNTSVPANSIITVEIPLSAMLDLLNVVQSKGIHVVSDNEVIIYGLNQREFSTDAYVAIPVDALGTDHYIMSYSSVAGTARSQFAVVATEDNTQITILSSVDLGSNAANTPFTVTLDEGESLQYRAPYGQDVTGTHVNSTKPISVFGSHLCANVTTDISYCDHLVEMIPSTDKWGQAFITVPFAERENGDIFRVIASLPNTVVSVNGTSTTLDAAGDFYEFNLLNASSITADKPILVAQFMKGNLADGGDLQGDPSMTILTPTEQFLGDYIVSTPAQGFVTHHINLIIPTGSISSLVLDGTSVSSALFNSVGTTGYSVAQVPVDSGVHALSASAAFGIAIYGANADDSYAYSGGQVYSAIAEVNSLTLSPDVSSGPIFSEQCVEATLLNSSGDPLQGTRVDFVASGVNTTSGFAFTNAAGVAEFCYTGENIGMDSVTASQGTLEASVVVNWLDRDCPDLEANIGDACDDGNDLTINDLVNGNCECAGTPIDTDFDCPLLEANIGDPCNDGNSTTENDMINGDCECMGTPIAFDCTDLEANFGDACNDGNDMTENDVINEDCECMGTPVEFDCPQLGANIGDLCVLGDGVGVIDENCECVPSIPGQDCANFVYYLTDHAAADGISDIYEVTINAGVATMNYVTTSDIEVHIAYNNDNKQIYAVSKHTNSYRTYDPATGVWGSTVALGADYGEITAAVFAPNGRLLIGSQNLNAIYSVNVMTNMVSSYDTYSPVTGGDLAFGSDGMLYMATRSGNGLYEVYPNPFADVLLSNVPSKVTGLAITSGEQLLLSAQGMTSLELYNTDGTSAGSYPLELEGAPYTLRDGDLASGCGPGLIIECENFATFYVNHGPDVIGSDLYTVDFVGGNAELTYITNVPFEAHIAYNSADELIYFVNKSGSFFRTYNVATDTYLGDITISGGISQLTAVEYNPVDKLLYVGDAGQDVIAQINLNTGIASYYADAPVYGGDLSLLNGKLYLARRSVSELYEIIPFSNAVLLGSIPGGVNGMAPSPNAGNLVTSSAAQNAFVEISSADGSTVSSFPAMLGGSPFTFINGDMASGCIDDYVLEPQKPVANELQGQLTAFPNPTSGQSQVVFVTAETGRALVEVFDMSGRNIATLFNQEVQQGKEYRLEFNGSSLPNGVYIYRMTTHNESIVEKFMIAH